MTMKRKLTICVTILAIAISLYAINSTPDDGVDCAYIGPDMLTRSDTDALQA